MIQKTIKIGSKSGIIGDWQVQFLKNELLKYNSDFNVVLIQSSKNNSGDLVISLLEESIDIAVYSMHDLPIKKTKGFITTATSDRKFPQSVLLIHRDNVDRNATLRLQKDTLVCCTSVLQKAQLMQILPNVQTVQVNPDILTNLENLKSKKNSALIISKIDIHALSLDLSKYEEVLLHPREFVPTAGQGVLAYQIRSDDMEMKKTLFEIGNREISYCTNVERKVQQLMDKNGRLGIYCQQDQMYNYHTWAAVSDENGNNLISCKISQSTYVNLAETIFENLQSQWHIFLHK